MTERFNLTVPISVTFEKHADLAAGRSKKNTYRCENSR